MTDPAVARSVDVAVIGGGMAGMSIAAELAGSRTGRGARARGRPRLSRHESVGGGAARELRKRRDPSTDPGQPPAPRGRRHHHATARRPDRLLWIAGRGARGRESPTSLPSSPTSARSPRPTPRRCARCCALTPSPRRPSSPVPTTSMSPPCSRCTSPARRRLARSSTDRAASIAPSGPTVGGSSITPRARCGADIVVNAAGAWADEVAARFGARPCNLRPLRRTIAIALDPAAGQPRVAVGLPRSTTGSTSGPEGPTRPDLSGRRDPERAVRRPPGRGRRRAAPSSGSTG